MGHICGKFVQSYDMVWNSCTSAFYLRHAAKMRLLSEDPEGFHYEVKVWIGCKKHVFRVVTTTPAIPGEDHKLGVVIGTRTRPTDGRHENYVLAIQEYENSEDYVACVIPSPVPVT